MFSYITKKALRVEVEKLNRENDVLTSHNTKLWEDNSRVKKEKLELREQLEEREKEITKLNEKIESKELQRRKLACKIGGLNTSANKTQKELEQTQKENKEMKEEIKDLKNKLEESMTDKYLIKKIPSGRTPKPEKMRIKSHAKQSKIIKDIKEN